MWGLCLCHIKQHLWLQQWHHSRHNTLSPGSNMDPGQCLLPAGSVCGEEVFMPHEGIVLAAAQAAQQATGPHCPGATSSRCAGAWTMCLGTQVSARCKEVPCRMVVFLRQQRTRSACFAAMLQAGCKSTGEVCNGLPGQPQGSTSQGQHSMQPSCASPLKVTASAAPEGCAG